MQSVYTVINENIGINTKERINPDCATYCAIATFPGETISLIKFHIEKKKPVFWCIYNQSFTFLTRRILLRASKYGSFMIYECSTNGVGGGVK
jgi:hypothetical protein